MKCRYFYAQQGWPTDESRQGEQPPQQGFRGAESLFRVRFWTTQRPDALNTGKWTDDIQQQGPGVTVKAPIARMLCQFSFPLHTHPSSSRA